ncbi:hypothetical protein PSTG_07414 [Puccinia striiformis f. sp. tritici PST-78]|uniref:DNA 3'-5' helicase n=3 Tax=Puccinia striiformis TaxID=27350 RepID=A0A0L0VJA1_9BASI|nr:hypothetical protein PSTG_14216 [Puccinia striiformis f. sp. tritici PST-78]KNE99296.1 hypothetical protein PSTG_07414 [Puccinia striiformis f. sp. tritici PST-78]
MWLRHLATPAIRNPRGSGVRIQILKKISDKKDEALKAAIAAAALLHYGQPAKPLQIEAVFDLLRGKNTFLLAGTGFGKSRIPEMYFKMLPRTSRGVVLVLNPLDALGNNQVAEKEAAGFTAINLTKLSFNKTEANKIANGEYQFVYLSPEIYLNNPLWEQVYFCPNFQNCLALIVVDEAHIIHQWGLMESEGSKNRRTLIGMLKDLGIFRPSYGKLGARFLTRNNKPILLMLATCWPMAIDGIKKSLKLENHNVSIIRGELTRPELRIIRVHMDGSMNLCSNLVDLFPTESDVADSLIVPSLIYCGTRNRTIHVMKALDRARKAGGRCLRPRSNFICRFHALTGNKDKLKVVQDYADGLFPIISCTMALGMGQNWSRVRSVIQIGRADPASICQMIGRCGRDGRPGLAIIIVEKSRRGGKNSVGDFDPNVLYDGHNDRMDALAITPVCLRIAFSMDNLLGYIPLYFSDPNYIKEQAQEQEANFSKCDCSNCSPECAEGLMRNMKFMTIENMNDFLARREWPAAPTEPVIKTNKRKRAAESPAFGKKIKLSKPLQEMLAVQLTTNFTTLFRKTYRKRMLFKSTNLFGKRQVDAIIKGFGTFDGVSGLQKAIGGKMIPGQLEMLKESIGDFTQGAVAEESKVIRDKASRDKEVIEEIKRKVAEERADKKEKAQVAKELKDNLSRIEAEKKAAQLVLDTERNAEQAAKLAVLIRLAGEAAERRGVESIHRGRYV